MIELPEGYHIKRVHLHESNSTLQQRHGHAYMTISKIVDRNGHVKATGYSYCSRKDNPSRALGRAIADGRALKNLYI